MEVKPKKAIEWIFFIPSIILIIYLIYRLINQGQMMWAFPLEVTSDYGTHIAQLHFFAKYGYHAMVPDWYNGFKLFLFYPPGWYFFTLPFYKAIGNILVATYTTVLLMFAGWFATIYVFGKYEGFSKIKRIAFFSFLFANTLVIGNYVRLGRVSEQFSMVLFFIAVCISLYYRNKAFSKAAYAAISILFAGMIISHPATAFAFGIILLSILISRKSIKECVILGLSAIISALLSAFWWYPFIANLKSTLIRSDFIATERLLSFSYWGWDSIATFAVIPIMLLLFFIYYKQIKISRKERLFFLPVLIAGMLVLTRLIVFIPLLNRVYPDIYLLIFVFFALFFLMKADLTLLKPYIRYIAVAALILAAIASIIMSEIHTSKFQHRTQLEYDTLDVMEHVEGKFYIHGSLSPTSHPPMYLSYASIYMNLTTSAGANNYGTVTNEYFNKLRELKPLMKNKDCNGFISNLVHLNTSEVIVFGDDCKTIEECGKKKVYSKGQACLFELKS